MITLVAPIQTHSEALPAINHFYQRMHSPSSDSGDECTDYEYQICYYGCSSREEIEYLIPKSPVIQDESYQHNYYTDIVAADEEETQKLFHTDYEEDEEEEYYFPSSFPQPQQNLFSFNDIASAKIMDDFRFFSGIDARPNPNFKLQKPNNKKNAKVGPSRVLERSVIVETDLISLFKSEISTQTASPFKSSSGVQCDIMNWSKSTQTGSLPIYDTILSGPRGVDQSCQTPSEFQRSDIISLSSRGDEEEIQELLNGEEDDDKTLVHENPTDNYEDDFEILSSCASSA